MSILDATREGAVVYDSTDDALKYCDGTNWVTAMRMVDDGTTCSAALEGTVKYVSAASPPYKYCNGSTWQDFSQGGGGTADLTPSAFSFTPLADQALSSVVFSSSITVAGLANAAGLGVTTSINSDGGPYFNINGAGWTNSGYVENGDVVQLMMTTASGQKTSLSPTLTIGTVSGLWSVTTLDVAPTVAFSDNAHNGNGGSSYSYTAGIGTASSDRYVVVSFQHYSNTFGTAASSVTIGGVAATEVVNSFNGGSEASLWIANVPTGTSAYINITLDGSTNRRASTAYVLYGLESMTPVVTATGTGAPPHDLSVSVPAGSVAVGANYAESCGGFTWSGLTENVDSKVDTSRRYSAASASFGSAGTQSISVGSCTSSPASVLAVWK
ncbi:MAG: hypothetical protein H6922_00510 [Pseudomonadaceae bacterium]|nr:hypothetical protein [Pseudomonadaceae bacterium]